MVKTQARRMGTMGDRVDLNAIRKLNQMKQKENQAYQTAGSFKERLAIVPTVMPSVDEIKKRQQAKDKGKR